MPRLTKRKAQECAEHGHWCKQAGGSDFVSERCSPRFVRHPRGAGFIDNVGEQWVMTDDSAFRLVKSLNENESGKLVTRSWWDRLSPGRKAAEVDNFDRRMAAIIRALKERWEAENPPPPASGATVTNHAFLSKSAREPATAAAPSAVNPSLSAQRPQEPAGTGVATEPPAPAEQPPTPRKRRRRKVRVRSITPIDGTFYL